MTAFGKKAKCMENLDLISPNYLLLGRGNKRSPMEHFTLSQDAKRIIQTNAAIFKSWFTICVHGPKNGVQIKVICVVELEML